MAALAASPSPLESAAQNLLDTAASKNGFALQLAFVSSTLTFSIAAGTTLPGKKKVTAADKFLFGSGTKPFTSAAILNLGGVAILSEPAGLYLDKSFAKLGYSDTFESLFGSQAKEVTVGMLLRMQSGICDFDVAAFDNALLTNGTAPDGPIAFVRAAANLVGPKFVCAPGACTSYSSTNYVLAGFVLFALDAKASSWQDVDQKTPVVPSALQPALSHSTFVDAGPIDAAPIGSTVAGRSRGFSKSEVSIYEQDATILGWTAGNLAAPTLETAKWFHALLAERTIVSPASFGQMTNFTPLSEGWAKGAIQYGTGMMIQQSSPRGPYPPNPQDWGAYLGHGGDTYGFLSEQGWIPQLNATFSVVANQDFVGYFVKNVLACNLIQLAAKLLKGVTIDLRCRQP